MLKSALLAAVVLAVSANVIAAEGSTPTSRNAPPSSGSALWGNIGLGRGSWGISGVARLNYTRDGAFYGLRTSGDGEFLGDDESDIALLYGVGKNDDKGGWTLSAGPAYGKFSYDGDDSSHCETSNEWFCSEDYSAWGLAIQAEKYWLIWDHAGIDVTTFANINDEHSFIGITIGGAFGRFH